MFEKFIGFGKFSRERVIVEKEGDPMPKGKFTGKDIFPEAAEDSLQEQPEMEAETPVVDSEEEQLAA